MFFTKQPYSYIHSIRLFHDNVLNHQDVDALVSFLPKDLSLEGPLIKQIMAKSGPDLDHHIVNNFLKPRPGQAFHAPGFAMPVSNLIFGIIPEWDGGINNEDRLLRHCYKNIIQLAQEKEIKSIAFPAMGIGRIKFPHIRFARLAVQGILDTLDHRLNEVRIVCKQEDMAEIYREQLEKQGWRH